MDCSNPPRNWNARAIDVAPGDPLTEKMQALDARTQRPADRILLNFGLAKAYEDAGDVDQSFAALKRANDLRRAVYPYDPAQETAFFAAPGYARYAAGVRFTF